MKIQIMHFELLEKIVGKGIKKLEYREETRILEK